MSQQDTGAGFAAVGTVIQAREQRRIGEIARDTADIEARNFEAQGRVALKQGTFEALRLLRESRRVTASNIARVGAGGGTLTGSKLLLIADSAANAELDARQIILNARTVQLGFISQAQTARFIGAQQRGVANIRAAASIAKGLGIASRIAPRAATVNKTPRPIPGISGPSRGFSGLNRTFDVSRLRRNPSLAGR